MKKRYLVIGIGAALLLAGGLFVVFGCNSAGSSALSYPSYGGTDPKGDFIVVLMDRDNQQVKKINFTEGETESSQSWYQYTAVSADTEYASGFSIVNRIDIEGGGYVLFAEIPDAACVFQAFDSEGHGDGNPVFLVAREAPAASSFYSRAYNWVKFIIDPTGTDSDMSCGFAAFDTSGEAGEMYGAAYSRKEEFLDESDGLSNINPSGDAGIDALTWDSGSGAFCIWEGATGDWSQAMAVTGTASGALILDWGPGAGGGGALAVPQTSAVDTLSTFWPVVDGTYLTMAYGYSFGEGAEIGPVKVVIMSEGSAGAIDVFNYSYRIEGGDSYLYNGPLALTRVEDEDISISFQDVAGNDLAASTVVQNAHKCQGAFVAYDSDEGYELLIMMAFDPSGRFFGFTMFEWISSEEQLTVRFGLGVKDANYDDAKAPSIPIG
ncbi:MAG: hypothetical protein JXQ30_11985 [Spirochaetes bacterium]|nr:hypothetical protein [Spirochaetota bacterium]